MVELCCHAAPIAPVAPPMAESADETEQLIEKGNGGHAVFFALSAGSAVIPMLANVTGGPGSKNSDNVPKGFPGSF
jgi:hypothetical protein